MRMLLSFQVSNFLSFDSPVRFDLTAAKEIQNNDRVARQTDGSPRILQSAVLFGGNAAGKSNLCKALKFAKNLIVLGTKPEGTLNRMPFKLRKAAVSSPSTFEFEILTGELGDEEIHRYSLHFSSREVVFESLVQIRPASERVIFTRHARGSEHDFNLEWVERKEWTEEDRQFARFVAKGTRKNQPFLTEAVDRNLKFFTSVASWFRDSLVIVDANVEYLSLETLNENRPELRAYVARMLNGSDTGIIAVEAEPVSIDSTGIPPMSREHLASTLKEGGSGALVRSIQGQRFSVYMQGGELKAAKAKLYRKSADDDTRVAFDVSEESDGTMRLFDLLPLFHELMVKGSRRTYVVDELDKSMHTHLTKKLFDYYLSSRTPNSRGQLIATLHDTELLDQKMFRRDEMWIVRRDKNGASTLTRISNERHLRHDKDLRRGYLQNTVVGLPEIKLIVEPTQAELF